MVFFQVEANYLAIAVRNTDWLSVFCLDKDDSAKTITVLHQYFIRWDAAKEITSDGASAFCSEAMETFLRRWGVTHKVSSAYYPRANKRAKLVVKVAKRIVTGILGPHGTLDTDRFARALLEHCTTPDPLHGLRPAVIIVGKELKSFLPAEVDKYQPQREADLREQAYAKRFSNMETRLLLPGAQLQGSYCHGHQLTTNAPPAGGPTPRPLLPWTPAPPLLPGTPTYHQGSSCRGPDFKAPPAMDPNLPPRLLLPGADSKAPPAVDSSTAPPAGDPNPLPRLLLPGA